MLKHERLMCFFCAKNTILHEFVMEIYYRCIYICIYIHVSHSTRKITSSHLASTIASLFSRHFQHVGNPNITKMLWCFTKKTFVDDLAIWAGLRIFRSQEIWLTLSILTPQKWPSFSGPQNTPKRHTGSFTRNHWRVQSLILRATKKSTASRITRKICFLREICEPLYKPGDATVELLKVHEFFSGFSCGEFLRFFGC